MSYQFYNNFPYYESVFPTMEDHVDPVNQVYFEGLHQEILNIEETLGVMVQDGFENIKQKLELHDHTGGVKGKTLYFPYPTPPYVDTYEQLPSIDTYSNTRTGFLFFGCAYLGPAEGSDKIQSYNLATTDWNYFVGSDSAGPMSYCVGDDNYIWFTQGLTPGKLIKFNPVDRSYTVYTFNAGENLASGIAKIGNYLYISLYTDPGKIIKFNIAEETWDTYEMPGGSINLRAGATDGTFYYTVTDTDPVKLIRFDPVTSSTYVLTLTGFNKQPLHMVLDGNLLYIQHDSTDLKVCVVFLGNMTFTLYQPGFPGRTYGMYYVKPYLIFACAVGSVTQFVTFYPALNMIYIPTALGKETCRQHGVRIAQYIFTGSFTVEYRTFIHLIKDLPEEE